MTFFQLNEALTKKKDMPKYLHEFCQDVRYLLGGALRGDPISCAAYGISHALCKRYSVQNKTSLETLCMKNKGEWVNEIFKELEKMFSRAGNLPRGVLLRADKRITGSEYSEIFALSTTNTLLRIALLNSLSEEELKVYQSSQCSENMVENEKKRGTFFYGEGSFAKVKIGVQVDSGLQGKLLAIKKSKESSFEDFPGKFNDMVENEVALQKLASRHQLAIPVLANVWTCDAKGRSVHVCAMNELPGQCGNVFIQQYWENSKSLQVMSLKDRQRLAKAVTLAVESLLNIGIRHGDLKLDNLSIAENGEHYDVQFLDFGHSTVEANTSFCLAALPESEAPELLALGEKSTSKIDIYRLAYLFMNMGVFLKHGASNPFFFFNNEEITSADEAEKIVLAKLEQCDFEEENLKQLIQSMLKRDPSLRPDIATVTSAVCQWSQKA